jgi:hypothetical protein
MRYVELNRKGDYSNWEDYRLRELVEVAHCSQMGNLIIINDKVLVWDLELFPGERISFVKHPKVYSWACDTGGMLVMANRDGRIDLLVFEVDDFGFVNNKNKMQVTDIRNIGDDVIRIQILEFL